MLIQEARALANDYLAEYGLLEQGWKFEFDNAKRRFGLTRYSTKTISLSKELTELNNPYIVIDTILHEIAHALVGSGNGHNRIWQTTAKSIGCNGERGYSITTVAAPKHKFEGTCPNCGQIAKSFKRGKYACKKCCDKYNRGFFNSDYLFKWERV